MSRHGIAIFGGSFDPVHLGHIQTAQDVQSFFQFKKVIFMPCGQQPLKAKTHADSIQRLEMLRLAINKHPHFEIDDREMLRKGPSFTVETLQELRGLYPKEPLIWLLGEDAFAHIKQWHRYQELLQFAHLLVLARPGTSPDWRIELKDFLQASQTFESCDLTSSPYGRIYIFEHGHYPFSSTQIKEALTHGNIPRGLQPMVAEYIQKNQLYHSNNQTLVRKKSSI